MSLQEIQGAFDIHKYGTTVLNSFTSKSKKKRKTTEPNAEAQSEEETLTENSQDEIMDHDLILPFKSIAHGRQAFEVSRLFLATLQLVSLFHFDFIFDKL